jgi:hypothetical protein
MVRTEVAQRSAMTPVIQRQRFFILSPATAHGPRAQLLRNPSSGSAFARRVREEGAPLGEVFSFLSGLYFRGKLEYARAFVRSARDVEGVHVITMTDGLRSPDARVSTQELERFALCPEGATASSEALERTAQALAQQANADAEIVLLGSVSTGKYTDILAPIFGERLCFPREILHIGQLARGALFLRRARERRELDYMPVAEIIRAGRRVTLRADAPSSADTMRETPRRATRPSTGDARDDVRR